MYSLLRTFLDQDQALLIILMLASIPLSYSLSLFKNKYLILALSIGCTFLFQSLMFPTQKYFLWIQQQIVYVLLKFGPRKTIGKIVLIQSFIYLAIVQFRRMYIAYGLNGVDITGILMMQTFLYIGLAYNFQNGLKPNEQLSQGAIKRKVMDLPDYLTYIGYVFFLPACLIGPVFEFRDYEDYLNRKGDYENIPSTIKPAVKQFGIFLLSLAIYVGTMSFDLWLTVKPEFDEFSYGYKMFYICAVIFHIQFRYVTAWSLGMISIHSSGLSYRKQTNSFDKISVSNLYGFYFDPSLKVKTQCWNMSVQVALKRYIYQQDYDAKFQYPNEKAKKKAQARAQRNTLMLSALWHGFYVGYFIAFFHWMIYLRMSQQLYRLRKSNKNIDDLWTKYHFGYVENLISHFVFSYFGIYLHVHTFQYDIILFKTTYAIPFIVLYTLYFFIYEAQMLSKPKKSNTGKELQKSTSSGSQVSSSSQPGSPYPYSLETKQKLV